MYRIPRIAAACLLAATSGTSAAQSPIYGALAFYGETVPIPGPGLDTAIALSFVEDFLVIGASADFAADGLGSGSVGSIQDFFFDGVPVELINVGSFTFVLEAATIELQDANLLEMTGTGTLSAAGFIDTPYELSLSADQLGGISTYLVVLSPPDSFPEKIELDARRNAGSQIVDGLVSSTLNNPTVTAFGLAAPDVRIVSINGDNGGQFSPYVEVGVGIEFYNVAPGSVLFSARTSDSTSPDVDLFVGRDDNGDGMISPDEELCQSGSLDANELCELSGDVVEQGGSYWVAVTNFESSGAPADDTVLTVSVAEPGTGNFSAVAPASTTAGEPWGFRLFWDVGISVGETLFGAVEIGNAGERLALVPVELRRLEDDVRVSVSDTSVIIGQVVDVQIEVEANLTPEDMVYTVVALIPDGLELVPGSVDNGQGSVVVANDQLTWTLPNPTLANGPFNYGPSINGPAVDTADPLYNPACDTGFGGYIDLELFGIPPDPAISGDGVSYLVLEGQNLPFFDRPKTGFTITDDGFGVFASGLGPTPWQNTSIPDEAEPNDMIALAWKNLEIVYDATANSGVTVQAPGPNLSVIEFDDMQPWPAGSTSDRIDFEVIFNGDIDDAPNSFEIVLAYDNVVGDWSDATIGLENQTGTRGTQYTGELSDGLMICYDYLGPDVSPKILNYQIQVTAAAKGQIVHEITNVVDNPGSIEVRNEVVFGVASDTDGDGVLDDTDNCTDVVNPGQEDFNGDSIGDICDADVTGPDGDNAEDCLVNFLDLQRIKAAFLSTPASSDWDEEVDFDNSNAVNFSDLAIMKSYFLGPPGPSASGCN